MIHYKRRSAFLFDQDCSDRALINFVKIEQSIYLTNEVARDDSIRALGDPYTRVVDRGDDAIEIETTIEYRFFEDAEE